MQQGPFVGPVAPRVPRADGRLGCFRSGLSWALLCSRTVSSYPGDTALCLSVASLGRHSVGGGACWVPEQLSFKNRVPLPCGLEAP